ncbi:MAG: sulfatase-like hydrolase/transferase [Caldilineaceae bacterium]|nr:sulfatase-like hydrolase/transferase [Caldilineaceae bacterium]
MQRPNILLIYTDQQRWDALGANGNPEILTPNLDRLAAEGVNFDHYFVQNPVCMPSRISFLTGQYPSTLGITHMGVPVPDDAPVLPRLLHNAGYVSANIGKLHFLPHANRDHRTVHPAYGFDQLEISDEPGVYEDAYRAWVRRTAPDQLPHLSVGLPPATAVWYETMGVRDPVTHPGQGGRFDFKGAVPFPGDESVTHSAFVAEQTMNFLRTQDGQRPFLCIAGFYSPHAPWVVPQRFLDLYDPSTFTLPAYPPEMEARRRDPSVADGTNFDDATRRSARHGYYAMVSEVDQYVGKILATLDEQGLSEKTIVVFTSDHGEWLGDFLRYGKGYPGEDAVSRVPLILRGPGLPHGGHENCHGLAEAVDVVPTLLELAGLPTPPHLQGRALTNMAAGADPGRDSVLMEFTGWKSLRSDAFRYIIHADGRELLYALDEPWGEARNVAPDPAYATTLADMRRRLLQRMVAMEQPLTRTWPY